MNAALKKTIVLPALLALAGLAQAINVTNYVPDGQFESPAGGAGPWTNVFGGDVVQFLATGGNPNGCAQITDVSSFGGFAYANPPAAATLPLSALGLVAGQTYTFVEDMKIVAGTNIGGLNIQSYNDSIQLGQSGNTYPASFTTNWGTYSYSYTISPGATRLNIVALWGANSTVAYDNLGVVVPTTPLGVAISSPAAGQVLYSSFTINATASVAPGAVTNVSFYIDNVLAGSATSSPFTWHATGVAAGGHALTAVAQASLGGSLTSSVVNITVTNGVFGAYEPFNYALGGLAGGTASTAFGCDGNWTVAGSPVITNGLAYPALPTANNALYSPGGSLQYESLAVPQSDGNVWVSFILKQAGDNGGARNGFLLEDSSGMGVMLAYQQTSGTQGKPCLVPVSSFTTRGTQLSPFSSTLETYTNANLYVLKLTYIGGTLNQAAVYANPTAGQGTAPAPDFTVTSGLSGGPLSVLGVLPGSPITIDEVRVGGTFASVVGGTLNPTIPTTLAVSISSSKQISWPAFSTNYYQPQSSTDNSTWTNFGSRIYGTNATSVFDTTPQPYYQVEEILPVNTQAAVNRGFETGDGAGGAAGWTVEGSQPPTLISTDFHTGTNCVFLFCTNNAGATPTSSGFYQDVAGAGGPAIGGGDTCYFSFWAKQNSTGVSYVQNYIIHWLDAGNVQISQVLAAIPNNAAWTQVSTGPIIAPANAVNAKIEFYGNTGAISNASGGVLIDDVSLVDASPTGTTNFLVPTIINGAVYTATVQTNGVTAGGATGGVTFFTNSVVQSLPAVAAGVAVGTPAIVPNSYSLTATYSGDATYIGSTTNLTIGGGAAPAPAITTIAPNTGRTNGGTVVTITGSNFLAGATVRFGANAGTGMVLTGATNLSVSTPAGSPGAVNVVVANTNNLSATNASGFTYLLPPPPATIVPGSVVKSGANLSMVWLGGTNAACPLLTTTNLSPPATWTPVATNQVGANGLSTNSPAVNPGEPKRFYRLSIPYN